MIYHKGRWLIAPEIKALLDKLEDMNEELRSEADRVLRENTVLREKQESDDRQIAEYKRLLKAAVEDIHELLRDKRNLDGNGQSCNICSYIEWCPCCKECTIREDLRSWRYADEALALIGEGGDTE